MSLSVEDRIKAEAQVEAFIEVLSKRFGIKEDEIPELVQTIRWSADHRRGINRMGWAALLGLLSLVISGAALTFWEGLKHMLEK